MTQPPPTATYFKHLANGRFLIQRSASTKEWVFYPRMMAPGSGATDLEWAEPSGRGTVYAATVSRKKPPEPSGSVVIVELDEGPRMMSRVDGIPAKEVRIGMRVVAKIVDGLDNDKIVVFVPEDRS